jgi:hypothetical protein
MRTEEQKRESTETRFHAKIKQNKHTGCWIWTGAVRNRSTSPRGNMLNAMNGRVEDAAKIALTLLSAATEALLVGPLLLGVDQPIHVMVPSVTARGIVNMTALAVAQADQAQKL